MDRCSTPRGSHTRRRGSASLISPSKSRSVGMRPRQGFPLDLNDEHGTVRHGDRPLGKAQSTREDAHRSASITIVKKLFIRDGSVAAHDDRRDASADIRPVATSERGSPKRDYFSDYRAPRKVSIERRPSRLGSRLRPREQTPRPWPCGSRCLAKQSGDKMLAATRFGSSWRFWAEASGVRPAAPEACFRRGRMSGASRHAAQPQPCECPRGLVDNFSAITVQPIPEHFSEFAARIVQRVLGL